MSSRRGDLPVRQSRVTRSASTPTSRRSLLAGIAGAAAGLVASALPRGARVQAANGDPVLVGGTHTGTATTSIENTAAGINVAMRGISDSGVGLLGLSDTHVGVEGFSTSGAGVAGHSDTDAGVTGFGPLGVWATGGIYGVHAGSDNVGVLGYGHGLDGSTGVLGFSAPLDTTPPSAKARTGVFGYAAQDAGSTGVWGKSPAGHGLHGESAIGWAGFFDGRVFVKRYQEFQVISTPGAPANNHARLFIRNNASGKTQLCVRFNTGAVRVLATEP